MQSLPVPLAVLLGLALVVAGCTSPQDPPPGGEDLDPTAADEADDAPPAPAAEGSANASQPAPPPANRTDPAPPAPAPPPQERHLATTQTFTLTSLSTPVVGGGRGDNCLSLATEGPTAVLRGVAVATWDTTLVPTLVLEAGFFADGGESVAVEGGPPLELPLSLATAEDEDFLRFFVALPEGAVGLAPGLEVEAAIAFDYTGTEIVVDEATITSCA